MANAEMVAKALSVSTRRVYQLVHDGMPQKARGQFEVARCMMWFIRHLTAELERRGPGASVATAGIAIAREGLTKAQRERIEMENAVRSGELVELETVRKEWTVKVSNAQKRLRAIPASIGPMLTNISEPAVIVTRLKKEIDGALTELAGGKTATTRATP